MLATLLASSIMQSKHVPVGYRIISLSETGVHFGNDSEISSIPDGDSPYFDRTSFTLSHCGYPVIHIVRNPMNEPRWGGLHHQTPMFAAKPNISQSDVFTRDGILTFSDGYLVPHLNRRYLDEIKVPFDADSVRFAYTTSITRLAIVVHRPSQLWTDVWTNSNGSWRRIDTQSQNFLFCPTSVTEDGTIVGSVYKTTDVELDPLAQGLARGMEYQSRVPLRPALWKEGKWTFPALPTSISKKHSFNVRLLMNWHGKNLAEIDEWNPQHRFDTFPLRYMIEHKNKYTDLTPALKPHFKHPKLLDYDITTGRILFVENDPKIDLDHRKYLIYQI